MPRSALVVSLLVLFPTTVPAATLHVPLDHATIQAALDAAGDGDEVVVAAGIWSANLVFPPRAVVLRSEGDDPSGTILDGSGPGDARPSPVILVSGDPDGTQRIRGFTIRRGRGGIATDPGADPPALLAVENCRVEDNVSGGGLRMLAGACEVRDCEFVSNRAGFAGGAMELRGSIVVERCLFRDNSAFLGPGFLTQGGAIYFNPFDDPGAELLVEDCEFVGNSCSDYGGAIHLSPEGRSTIRASRFYGNKAGVCAGAIYLFGSEHTLVESNLLVDNVSPLAAGIGVHFASFTTIRGNTIVGSKGGGDSEGIRMESAFLANLERNIVAFGEGYGVQRLFSSGGSLCNDWYGNALGDHAGSSVDPSNFSADPLFCDAVVGDYGLRAGSPCAPPGSGDCDLVGAFPVACGPLSVEPSSWAEVKARYRGPTR